MRELDNHMLDYIEKVDELENVVEPFYYKVSIEELKDFYKLDIKANGYIDWEEWLEQFNAL